MVNSPRRRFFGAYFFRYNGGMKKYWALAILLGGCASVEDFRAMPPAERADYVCERHREVVSLEGEISATESLASDTRNAIAAGYRTREVCRQVPFVSSTEEVCETDKKGRKVCKKKSKVSRQTVCDETVVAIDGRLEQEKLRDYQRELRDLNARADSAFDRCHEHVRRMSADRAFDYYQSNRGGFLLQ